jgi:hypothetical protein
MPLPSSDEYTPNSSSLSKNASIFSLLSLKCAVAKMDSITCIPKIPVERGGEKQDECPMAFSDTISHKVLVMGIPCIGFISD